MNEDKVIQSYLIKEKGFTWGALSDNWIMYSMWEPQVLEKMQYLATMHQGHDTNIVKIADFWKILEEGFKTFELKLDSIIEPSKNYIMVREQFIHLLFIMKL